MKNGNGFKYETSFFLCQFYKLFGLGICSDEGLFQDHIFLFRQLDAYQQRSVTTLVQSMVENSYLAFRDHCFRDYMRLDHVTDKVCAGSGNPLENPRERDYLFVRRTENAEKADVVITHGGSGAIIGAIKKGKKVIAVARRAKYGEHVDDHQTQLVQQLRKLNIICECQVCDDIWKAIEAVKIKEYKSYQSHTDEMIKSIEKFISTI